jgi:hypothetical protein
MSTKNTFTDSICEEQISLAERELSAFVNAITNLFGPQQERFAAEVWLAELEQADSAPRGTLRDWRAVSVAASARLASLLALAQHHQVSARRAH